jgi:hypothetical protein
MANSASAAGSSAPLSYASRIARPDLINILDATDVILVPASCRVLSQPLDRAGAFLDQHPPVPGPVPLSRVKQVAGFGVGKVGDRWVGLAEVDVVGSVAGEGFVGRMVLYSVR